MICYIEQIVQRSIEMKGSNYYETFIFSWQKIYSLP